MTREGEALRLYGTLIEERPFSRFSRVEAEQTENSAWRKRGLKWAETHVDAHGNWDGEA